MTTEPVTPSPEADDEAWPEVAWLDGMPWAMLHSLPDGTVHTTDAESAAAYRAATSDGERESYSMTMHANERRFLNNQPVFVAEWPDGTTPGPPAAPSSSGEAQRVERPVRFIDPDNGKEVAYTAREAAALIVSYQAMEADAADRGIDPNTTFPEVVDTATVLLMASDGECYGEHTEAHVLPFAHEPHAYVPTGDRWASCEVCGDDKDIALHTTPAASGEAQDPDADEPSRWAITQRFGSLGSGQRITALQRLGLSDLTRRHYPPHVLLAEAVAEIEHAGLGSMFMSIADEIDPPAATPVAPADSRGEAQDPPEADPFAALKALPGWDALVVAVNALAFQNPSHPRAVEVPTALAAIDLVRSAGDLDDAAYGPSTPSSGGEQP